MRRYVDNVFNGINIIHVCMFFLELESQPFALNTNGNITTLPWKENVPRLMGENGQRGIFAIVTHEYFSSFLFFFKTKIHRNQEWGKHICTMSIDFFPRRVQSIFMYSFPLNCVAQNHDGKIFNPFLPRVNVIVNELKFIQLTAAIFSTWFSKRIDRKVFHNFNLTFNFYIALWISAIL